VQPHEYSADGVRDLMRTVQAIQDKVNPDLVVDGLIINGVRPTTGEHSAWVEEYRRQFGATVLEPPVAERIVVAEAQRAKMPLEFYHGRGAPEAREWFRALATQLAHRTGLVQPKRRGGRRARPAATGTLAAVAPAEPTLVAAVGAVQEG
jgi:cellulose biosynthesis protein BcsQ